MGFSVVQKKRKKEKKITIKRTLKTTFLYRSNSKEADTGTQQQWCISRG